MAAQAERMAGKVQTAKGIQSKPAAAARLAQRPDGQWHLHFSGNIDDALGIGEGRLHDQDPIDTLFDQPAKGIGSRSIVGQQAGLTDNPDPGLPECSQDRFEPGAGIFHIKCRAAEW